MPECIVISPAGQALAVVTTNEGSIQQLSIPGLASPITLQPGETHLDALARKVGQYDNVKISDCTLVPTELPKGEYYPRIARPIFHHGQVNPKPKLPDVHTHANELASLRGQLVSLMRTLERICQTVHPTKDTFGAYGHDIRNLLILACTEVETHWRAVLVANGVSKQRFDTNDYVKLAAPMKLTEYAVSLPYYPWLDPFRPFAAWPSSKPTQDLKWYDAYNNVKHDREGNFSQATLEAAFNAVVACAVLLVAQFGPMEAFRRRVEFGWFFAFQQVPTWEPSQIYVHPDPATWVVRPFPFP